MDVARFAPREPAQAKAGVRTLTTRLKAGASGVAQNDESDGGRSAFARDEWAAAEALERLNLGEDQLVAFVGKLIVSKGVDLLIAAWPLVLECVPRARLVVVGFGAYREGLERLLDALATGDLERAMDIAHAGRALETQEGAGVLKDAPSHHPLRHLLVFFDSLQGDERERYLSAARALSERVVLTGRLDHAELVELLPACEALVVPSTFPESFGMVAAEAAACGVLPVSAAHSGLAEVSAALARAVGEQAAGWLSFTVDDGAVRALAQCVIGWLRVDPALRSQIRAGLIETVRERWSWEGVARGAIAAMRGELDGLEKP